MACFTSGSVCEPVMIVKVPRAFISGRTPIDSYRRAPSAAVPVFIAAESPVVGRAVPGNAIAAVNRPPRRNNARLLQLLRLTIFDRSDSDIKIPVVNYTSLTRSVGTPRVRLHIERFHISAQDRHRSLGEYECGVRASLYLFANRRPIRIGKAISTVFVPNVLFAAEGHHGDRTRKRTLTAGRLIKLDPDSVRAIVIFVDEH